MAKISLARLRRTLSTLRHLRPRQAFYYIWRRGIGARKVAPWRGDIKRREFNFPDQLKFAHSQTSAIGFSFTFLKKSLSFPITAMEWNPTDENRLWRYNLHYFDFLSDSRRSLEEKCALIDDWITHNPQGSEPAWEPYTASLRIVNWCKFFSSIPIDQAKPVWLNSLYQQARWLEKNLELHILANHYFENIKALLFTGIFFDDKNSASWLKKFQRELIEQLHEQTLTDGGHYERSPQYHCILLEDYLDLFALTIRTPTLFNQKVNNQLSKTISAALTIIQAIKTPDDDIPLFNDSASGAAAKPSAIMLRAQQLGFSLAQPENSDVGIIELPDTGLYGYKTQQDYFLIDCGDIGPSYQPGHTHCDFLSYVLMVDGQWLVVDSGVFEYEPGEMRNYVRSTAAHNTVSVDGQEQSEIWGEFRVGYRAKRLAADITTASSKVIFDGAFRGFSRISGGIEHRRKATLTLATNSSIQEVKIEDLIIGAGSFPVQSYVHLHPSLRVVVSGTRATLYHQNNIVAALDTFGVAAITQSSGWHCQEFGLKQSNCVLILESTTSLPLRFGYTIKQHRSV